MKPKLTIAVRTLVMHVLRAGDLEQAFSGTNRSVEAIRAHQKIQHSRPQSYRSEVPVTLGMETEHFDLTITGRIDGVFQEPEQITIDEIKTTTRSLEYFDQQQNPVHWGQAMAYAHMYVKEKGLSKVEVQLTYYRIDTGEIREYQRSETTATLEAFFQDLVTRYLNWAQTLADWVHMRNVSTQALTFPFPTFRPGQRRLAVAVYRTMQHQGQLLAQAPTGIGKTMAVLFPVIKLVASLTDPKIFYLTARTTGRTVAEQALDEMRRHGLRLKTLTLTAKDRICFNPEATCDPEECAYAKGHFDRLGQALEETFRQDAFTRNTIETAARQHQVCPFEFSLDLAQWSDCIICDYNYAFDPRVHLRRFFLETDFTCLFLVDEAHNLVDRSREMFSACLDKEKVLALRRELPKKQFKIHQPLNKINSWMVNARRNCHTKTVDPQTKWYAESQAPEDLIPLLRRFTRAAENWLGKNQRTPFREALLELFFDANSFLRVAEQYNEAYVTIYERQEKQLTVKLYCLDPAPQMKNALQRCAGVVFFSATLTPAHYFWKMFGCAKNLQTISLPSPFPSQNLGLFVADDIATYYHQRDRTRQLVAETIRTLVAQKRGNYLLFFPSYAYLRMVQEILSSANSDFELLVQTPGMKEADKKAFLARFEVTGESTLVAMAVMGGIFGEGIDLVGDRLSGAIVVGVGLPGISPQRELIRDYFDQRDGAGFAYAYQYPGINRVLQAAGRVIRSETDRGVVLLIDQRFRTQRYRKLLPNYWQIRRLQHTQHFKADLRQFWKPE